MYTYLAVRQEILDLDAVAASVADTEFDISAFVPAEAHTAIVTLVIDQTAMGGAAVFSMAVYKSLAQGYAIQVFGFASERDSLGAQVHIPLADGKLRYAIWHPGGALRLDINLYLLGYIE